MKRLLIFVCALSTIICCMVSVFADPLESAQETEEMPVVETVETPAGQTVSVTMSPVMAEQRNDAVAVYDANDQYEHEAGTLPALVQKVFGVYTPRTQSVTVYLSDGTMVESTEVIAGVAGMDWYWLSGACLFFLVLWSFFRFLGVVLKHG